MNAARGDADGGAVRRHVLDDDGVGADHHVVADLHGPDDLGPGAEEDAVAESRELPPFGADRDLVFDLDIRPADDAAVDDDAVRVNDHEPWAEFGAAADDAAAEP